MTDPRVEVFAIAAFAGARVKDVLDETEFRRRIALGLAALDDHERKDPAYLRGFEDGQRTLLQLLEPNALKGITVRPATYDGTLP